MLSDADARAVDPDEYEGPATLHAGDEGTGTAVLVRLAGRFEPVDGRYHWTGRVAPDPVVAGLVRSGRREARLEVPDGRSVPVRLSEVDPWGGVRVTGTGRPPWVRSR